MSTVTLEPDGGLGLGTTVTSASEPEFGSTANTANTAGAT